MSWEEHQGATFSALSKVEDVQIGLNEVLRRMEEAQNAIRNAIGDSNVESAMNFLQFMLMAAERIHDIQAIVNQATEEGRRYLNGF
jgi:hypothetical protein